MSLKSQPRRLAAISGAQRIASERGEQVGTDIGYQVRLGESKYDSTCSKIQELVKEHWLGVDCFLMSNSWHIILALFNIFQNLKIHPQLLVFYALMVYFFEQLWVSKGLVHTIFRLIICSSLKIAQYLVLNIWLS